MLNPTWITLELAEAIHSRQIAEHGGSEGVRDRGMLESALARPQQLLSYGRRLQPSASFASRKPHLASRLPCGPDVDLAALAASYAYGIARNHPFVDGNKRTAAVVCEFFLEFNDYLLLAEDVDLYPVFLGLAAGEISETELVDWLRRHSRPARVNEESARYG